MQADLSLGHLVRLEEMLEIEGGTGQDSASLAWTDCEERLSLSLGLAKRAGLPPRV